MKTLLIDIEDNASVKLFQDLAKKLHLNSHVLTQQEKEDMGLLSLMKKRIHEKPLPVKSAYSILKKVK